MANCKNGDYDWAEAVKALDETKAGVKGLVDAGVTELPRLFVHPSEDLNSHPPRGTTDAHLPTIDLHGLEEGEGRKAVVEQMSKAASKWGFFRIVNHGIPMETMEATLAAVRRFHELPVAEKKPYYTYDMRALVKYNSSIPTMPNSAASWRDILTCNYKDGQLQPQDIPSACRNELQEYVEKMVGVREIVEELLSEALGLPREYMGNIECMKSQIVSCLYYPACPEPDKALGNPKHSDVTFLTLLMQDTIGGLQILHDDQWLDVPPVPGALIANIGDLMQIISNDKFISVEHRVRSQPVGPRISVASFFTPSMKASAKPFGPIKEIVSDEKPAVYKEFFFAEYCKHYRTNGHDQLSALDYYKI